MSAHTADQRSAIGYEMYPDSYISDFKYIPFLKRLFSRPWKPFKKYEYSPIAYIMNTNVILVSHRTYEKIKKGEIDLRQHLHQK